VLWSSAVPDQSQLQLFSDAPPDADVRPAEPTSITPGKVRVPVALSSDDRRIRKLTSVVMDVYDETQDLHCYDRCVSIWHALLRRYEPSGETDYLEAIKPWSSMPNVLELVAEGWAQIVNHFWIDGFLSDLLGPVFESVHREIRGSKWIQDNGVFFTSWELARMAASQTMAGVDHSRFKEGPEVSVQDPACGSGVMLLAARSVVAERHGREGCRYLRCYGQDLNLVCVQMCQIQMRTSDADWMTSWMLASYGELGHAMGEKGAA
jgi:hypothetical protein